MDLVVDDRERAVIIHLKDHRVDRLTVGDYAFVYKGKVLLIVERKTLADLAASIRDGRMQNNEKLLEARTTSGCQLMYIIEGPAYPSLTHRFGRITFAALQGKIDSLMFRHDIKIVWTKNVKHTAERLMGLKGKMMLLVEDNVYGGVEILKKKQVRLIKDIHYEMVRKIPRLGHVKTLEVLSNTHISLIMSDGKLSIEPSIQHKILSVINGVSPAIATIILANVTFRDIVLTTYIQGSIANLLRGKKKIGTAIESRIKETFAL